MSCSRTENSSEARLEPPTNVSIVIREAYALDHWVLAQIESSRLCLNVAKTKYMIFDRSVLTSGLNLTISNQKLEQITNFNYLGLQINDNLNWSLHINNICNKKAKYRYEVT